MRNQKTNAGRTQSLYNRDCKPMEDVDRKALNYHPLATFHCIISKRAVAETVEQQNSKAFYPTSALET